MTTTMPAARMHAFHKPLTLEDVPVADDSGVRDMIKHAIKVINFDQINENLELLC